VLESIIIETTPIATMTDEKMETMTPITTSLLYASRFEGVVHLVKFNPSISIDDDAKCGIAIVASTCIGSWHNIIATHSDMMCPPDSTEDDRPFTLTEDTL
jgi:hypothetical protein